MLKEITMRRFLSEITEVDKIKRLLMTNICLSLLIFWKYFKLKKWVWYIWRVFFNFVLNRVHCLRLTVTWFHRYACGSEISVLLKSFQFRAVTMHRNDGRSKVVHECDLTLNSKYTNNSTKTWLLFRILNSCFRKWVTCVIIFIIAILFS